MSDFYDYCNPNSRYLILNNGIFFFSKIFGETQDEVSIFILLHTINFFFNFFFDYYHIFFTKFCWGTCFRGRFFGPHLGWSHMGGGTHDGDGVR